MGGLSRRKVCNDPKAWVDLLSTIVDVGSCAVYIILDDAFGWGMWRMRWDGREVGMRGWFG